MMDAARKRRTVEDRLPPACVNEREAYQLLETLRWGDSPTCPLCGGSDVYQVRARSGGRGMHYRWCCRECRRQYTVRKGTVMEQTRIPLQVWCYACWAVCTSKAGVSPLQIARGTGLTARSARYLLARIRFAMQDGLLS